MARGSYGNPPPRANQQPTFPPPAQSPMASQGTPSGTCGEASPVPGTVKGIFALENLGKMTETISN